MILSKDCTNKSCMFKDCSSLIQLNDDEKDISFDNDNILDFDYNNKDTNNNDNNSLLDISKWKILNSIDMNKMFYNCFSVNYINYLNDNYLSLENIPDSFIITKNIFNKNSEFYKNCVIIKSVYEIKGKTKIKIYDEDFVSNNENNIYCKMIINNKINKLTDVYEITDNKMKFLKVKLIMLKNKKIDFSYMFYNCDSLIDFKLISEGKVEIKNRFQKNKEANSIAVKNENLYQEKDNKSDNFYKTYQEEDIYPISNNSRLNSFYNNSCENNSISFDCESDEEKNNNTGDNFLSNSFNSNELMHNDNEFFSNNTNSFSSSIIKIVQKKYILVEINIE